MEGDSGGNGITFTLKNINWGAWLMMEFGCVVRLT
jgi:hypothetical protein